MSKEASSNCGEGGPSRGERRRRARELRKKLQQMPDQRSLLVKEGLTALAHQAGLAALYRLMEEDINQECGVRGKWEQNPEGRQGSRNGWAPGLAWLGGKLVEVERPRAVYTKARGGREIPLESYLAAQDPEFLSNAVLTSAVLGVSMRSYSKVIGAISPGPRELVACGLSKSAVGRRFLAASEAFLTYFLDRRLNERYLAVWVDAVAEGDYSVLAAVGLMEDGSKKVLGLRQGATETADFCREFLEELIGRGLQVRGLLWVVDGGAGMVSALREVVGPDALIQRCRLHKKRNVLDKLTLSEDDKKLVSDDLDRAWAEESPALAQAFLELLIRNLESRGQRSAARSLREGLREMQTCCRLEIPLELMASLTNTNVIESMFSVHEAPAHRVRRWRNGKQVLRWVAAASYTAERGFSRVSNPAVLRKLAEALDRHARRTASKERPATLAVAS